MAGRPGKSRALRVIHSLKDRFRIHEPIIDDHLTTDPQVRVKEGRAVTIVKGQDRHHAVLLI